MTSIFVAKLDFNVTNDELKDTFQRFGTVLKATVALDKETGKSRGFGFVEMQNADEAKRAIEALDGFKFNGRPIAVKEAEQRGGNDNRKPFSQDRNQNAPRGEQNYKKSEPRVKNEDDELPFVRKEDIVVDPIIPLKTDRTKTKVHKDIESPKKAIDKDLGKKATKMDAYKKSGKNNIYFEDEDDEELDLFGRSQEEEDEDDYRKYLVNSDEDEEEWDDDDEWEDEEDEDEDEN